MDYSKMSPLDIAKNIVDLAQHTDVDSQPIPRCPWGAATALGALPVARALIDAEARVKELEDDMDGSTQAIRVFSVNYDASQARVKELETEAETIVGISLDCEGTATTALGAFNDMVSAFQMACSDRAELGRALHCLRQSERGKSNDGKSNDGK